jgi:uncharacterized phage-associated protein
MSFSRSSKTVVIANYLLHKGREDKIKLTNKSLQKLVYYCQAWHLVFYNKPLFDEPIEAWIHGPAVPSVYRRFSTYSYMYITEDPDLSRISELSTTETKLIDEVWKAYGSFDAGYLEALTHREKPWINARASLLPYESSSATISLTDMKDYYGERLKKAKPNTESTI